MVIFCAVMPGKAFVQFGRLADINFCGVFMAGEDVDEEHGFYNVLFRFAASLFVAATQELLLRAAEPVLFRSVYIVTATQEPVPTKCRPVEFLLSIADA